MHRRQDCHPEASGAHTGDVSEEMLNSPLTKSWISDSVALVSLRANQRCRWDGRALFRMMATWAEMPRSPGHAFYDRLQELLSEAGFDAFVEQVCKPYYAPRMGAPSLPPGRYFRMHMIGYFEGLDSCQRRCKTPQKCRLKIPQAG